MRILVTANTTIRTKLRTTAGTATAAKICEPVLAMSRFLFPVTGKDVLGMWVGENESAKFVTAQPQPSSKNKAGAKSGSSKFSFCKCRAACPTTAADHVRTCGHSDYALGHKDVLQSRPVKNENTHTASNDWPWPFLQCCRESHWIVPLWGC